MKLDRENFRIFLVPVLWFAMAVGYLLVSPPQYCFLRPVGGPLPNMGEGGGGPEETRFVLAVLLLRLLLQVGYLLVEGERFKRWKGDAEKASEGRRGRGPNPRKGMWARFYAGSFLFMDAVYVWFFVGWFALDPLALLVGILALSLYGFFAVFPEAVVLGGLAFLVAAPPGRKGRWSPSRSRAKA